MTATRNSLFSLVVTSIAMGLAGFSQLVAAAEARLWPQPLVLEHYELYAAKAAYIAEFAEFESADILPTVRQAEAMLEPLLEEPWLTPEMATAVQDLATRYVELRDAVEFPGVTRDLLRKAKDLIDETKAVLATGHEGDVWFVRPYQRFLWRTQERLAGLRVEELRWNELLPYYATTELMLRVGIDAAWFPEAEADAAAADLALLQANIERLLNRETDTVLVDELNAVIARIFVRIEAAELIQPTWDRIEIYWAYADMMNEMTGQFGAFRVRRNVLLPLYSEVIAVAGEMKAQDWSDENADDKIDFQCDYLRSQSANVEAIEYSERHKMALSFAILGFAGMAAGE